MPSCQIMGVVDVKQTGEHELMLEWDSSASNDMIADSTLALITGVDKSPASVKRKLHLIPIPCIAFSVTQPYFQSPPAPIHTRILIRTPMWMTKRPRFKDLPCSSDPTLAKSNCTCRPRLWTRLGKRRTTNRRFWCAWMKPTLVSTWFPWYATAPFAPHPCY
jgi:Pre-mRNA 3'-end-processing endonuclease polyadenylation factor C-term